MRRAKSVSALADSWYERAPDDWRDVPASMNGRTLFSLSHRGLVETRALDGVKQWRRKAGLA